jgi:hypothetical protein
MTFITEVADYDLGNLFCEELTDRRGAIGGASDRHPGTARYLKLLSFFTVPNFPKH